jgi:serine/threonine protein phosphatase PrpC
VVVGGGSVFLAHVGDSRAYLLREGELLQLSDDHSMVNELVRSGQMTYEEAKRSRYRNVITRAIGLHPTVQPDVAAIEILPGDRIVLCSDGLSDPVKPQQLAQLLSRGTPRPGRSGPHSGRPRRWRPRQRHRHRHRSRRLAPG